ncbi:MAG: amidohydrolase [Candidatus Omnitrophica bacterium]|nr:amidohydrolase [Candidatus Omnitrophota bacterium]
MDEAIDVFCHCLTPRFCNRALEVCVTPPLMWTRALNMKVMVDIEARLSLMKGFPGYRQIPSLASPPIEMLGTPEETPELARIANDELAEMCQQRLDEFPSFVASLPLNNPEESMVEAERATRDLGAAGIQIFTPVLGRAVDQPEILQLFELMGTLGKAVWLHPAGGMNRPDYQGEKVSRFESWWTLRWPYESSLAMYRLIFTGIFDRYPDLPIVTHHSGGMIPMMAGRLGSGLELLGTRTPPEMEEAIAPAIGEKPLEAMRRFYADTATFGSRSAIECGLEFFGPDRMLFASDMPFDPEEGPGYIRETLKAIGEMNISDEDRQKVLSGNAERIFRLKREGE